MRFSIMLFFVLFIGIGIVVLLINICYGFWYYALVVHTAICIVIHQYIAFLCDEKIYEEINRIGYMNYIEVARWLDEHDQS